MKKMDSVTAMRETLNRTAKRLIAATEDDRYGDDLVYLVCCMREVAAACRAALAAPLRNCDVGTPDEQSERFGRFCGHYRVRRCKDCPLLAKVPCEFEWAQMPYGVGL